MSISKKIVDDFVANDVSFITTVPAFSTTANTITAQSARRVANVMLANACQQQHNKTTRH